MSGITVKRVEESKYQLMIDGDLVEEYNQTVMSHPIDWSDDAKDNGASEKDIRHYDYRDLRR